MTNNTPGHYLEDFVTRPRKGSPPEIISAAVRWAERALKAPRFLLPDGGPWLDAASMVLAAPFRLPYPDTVFEYRSFGTVGPTASTIILATEYRASDGGLRILIREFFRSGDGDWIMQFGDTQLACDQEPFAKGSTPAVEVVNPETGAVEPWVKNVNHSPDEGHMVVLAVLSLLQCVNVETEIIPAPERLNKKRVAQGKLPFVEYKRLVVRRTLPERLTPGDATHASPRQHLRRGHIRRLPSTRTVWVSQCLVGDPQKGFIVKDYVVRA